MIQYSVVISLMLIASISFPTLAASIHLSHSPLHSRRFSTPRSSRNLSPGDKFDCPGGACTEATTSRSAGNSIDNSSIIINDSVWTFVYDTDFKGQDIYPFILAGSFESCLNHCQDYNIQHEHGTCSGFVWAPERSHLADDCYLKSSVNDPVNPASLHLLGATLHQSTSTIISPIPPLTTNTGGITVPSDIPALAAGVPGIQQTPPEMQLQPEQIRIPTVVNSTCLGTSINEVVSQYVSHAPAKPVQIAADLLEAGINTDLITKYPLASDTGSWTTTDDVDFELANMTVTPRFSRDGGRGGNINGTNVFIFCDTSTYGEEKNSVLGYLNGFVSSSVAVDESLNGLRGQPLSLVNSVGQWQDDVGRTRGWVPMTTGEEAFNTAISGQGFRYAVWPNSSPISLNDTHAVMYAPLVYLEVDMQDQSSPRYTSLGNTLLLITIDPIYGPHAERLERQFFKENEVNWGSIGGIRSWSKDGRNSINGDMYLFGQANDGILLARVPASDFDDRSKYNFWNGRQWSTNMLPVNATPNAFMINQSVMNMDIIYSPAHRNFIMIYLTPEADNTFYYQYLVRADGRPLDVIPPYEENGDENYVENLLMNKWSEPQILFTVPAPARGYIYAGGLHAGYFGNDDITNGGTKMLCTWTEHTLVDPDKPDSGYAHKSQIIDLGWDAS